MNPVFVFLVILGAVVLWFMMSGMFKIVGDFFSGIFDNMKRAINDQETNEEAFIKGFQSSKRKEE